MSSSEAVYVPPELADGTLVVIVCRAKHLPNRRKLDKQLPYVTLRIGTTAQRTQAHFRAGQTPEWTQEVRFQLTRDRKPILKLDVLDETKNDPTPIGNTEIDCLVIFATPENRQPTGKYIYDRWYDLTMNSRRAGMIYLEMTFYPSAPITPPKILDAPMLHHIKDEPEIYGQHSHHGHMSESDGALYGQHSSGGYFPASIQSSQGSPKKSFHSSVHSDPVSLLKNSAGSGVSNHTAHSDVGEVFVREDDAPKKTNKYAAKFQRLKSKLAQKDHITTLWTSDGSVSPEKPTQSRRQRSASPISAYDVDMSELQKALHGSDIKDDGEYDSGHLDDEEAPAPPPHLVTSRHSDSLPSLSSRVSNHPLPPVPSNRASKSPTRKPPRDFTDPVTPASNTAVPFSADSIGMDEEDEVLPTKVKLFGEDVKPLTFNGGASGPVEGSFGGRAHRMNPDEIDPRFYAPTPGEHMEQVKLHESQLTYAGRKAPTRMKETDLRTLETGYLGNGKFSPSVFQRMVQHDYDDLNESDIMSMKQRDVSKPRVPPKIPQGLTELEYYLLEKEKYLRDVSGNRL